MLGSLYASALAFPMFASTICAIPSHPLYTVGKLLGHKSVQTTQRYAHLSVEAQKLAADKVAAALNKMAK
jgi:integrase